MSTVTVTFDVDVDDLLDDVDNEYLLEEMRARGLDNPADFSREEVQYLIDKLDDEPVASVGDAIRTKLVQLRMEVN